MHTMAFNAHRGDHCHSITRCNNLLSLPCCCCCTPCLDLNLLPAVPLVLFVKGIKAIIANGPVSLYPGATIGS